VAALIVVEPLPFNLRLGGRDPQELVHIQTLTPRVFDRFSRSNEIELYAAPIRPVLERPRLKLRLAIEGDRAEVST